MRASTAGTDLLAERTAQVVVRVRVFNPVQHVADCRREGPQRPCLLRRLDERVQRLRCRSHGAAARVVLGPVAAFPVCAHTRRSGHTHHARSGRESQGSHHNVMCGGERDDVEQGHLEVTRFVHGRHDFHARDAFRAKVVQSQ